MTLYVFALYVLPFLLIIGSILWRHLHVTRHQRCRRLLVLIVAHPNYYALHLPKLLKAVEHRDLAYLKAHLSEMGKP